MAISVVNARFLGFWLMLILTGVYMTFLPRLVSVLRRKWKDGVLLWWLPVASALFFFILFLDLGIEIHLAWEAFSVNEETPGNPEAYLDTGGLSTLIKGGLTASVVILSDIILVYRTYVVWTSHRWIIVLPFSLLLAGVATGIWATWMLSQDTYGEVSVSAAATQRVLVFFVLTFVLNLACSGLTAFKLWWVSSKSTTGGQTVQGGPTGKVLSVLIESAAIYCGHLFALIVASAAGSNMFFALLSLLPQTTALVFSLLILRIASKASRDSTADSGAAAFSRTRSQQSTAGIEIDLERATHGRADSATSVRSAVYGTHEHTGLIAEDNENKHSAL